MNKKYHYDKSSDSLQIYLREGVEENFEEIAPGINVELDKSGEVIGVEILKASRFSAPLKKQIAVKR